MNKKKSTIMLLCTALIWGVAFVAQREGGDILGPYIFSVCRFLLGGVVLLPVIKILDHYGYTKTLQNDKSQKKLLIGGGLCGCILAIFTILQQLGLYYGTSAGKAGFLTACYIVLVPVLGIFVKRKCGINVWIAVGITLVGLYLLCLNGETASQFQIQKSDGFVILCSLLCAIHILVVDHFVADVDGVRMSCIQFFVAAVVSLIPTLLQDVIGNEMLLIELKEAFTSKALWIALLYTGVLSSGVAYTFQIVGQEGMNPTVASLIMSLESVFSVIAGMVLLHETMGTREILGCVFIFIAVILAQLNFQKHKSDVEEMK